MDFQDERNLRDRVSYLALEWHEGQGRSFTGETASQFETMVTAAHVISDEARLSLHRWVDAARRAGLSWTDIGARIGITKQAAQQRFGTGGPAPDAPLTEAEIVRTGATAFHEEAMLAEEGRAGRELVATGALFLRFRQSDRPWEHRRVVAFSPAAALRQVEGAGWSHVSTWFPFHYLKRPAATD
jgi:hypothetical protein